MYVYIFVCVSAVEGYTEIPPFMLGVCGGICALVCGLSVAQSTLSAQLL